MPPEWKSPFYSSISKCPPQNSHGSHTTWVGGVWREVVGTQEAWAACSSPKCLQKHDMTLTGEKPHDKHCDGDFRCHTSCQIHEWTPTLQTMGMKAVWERFSSTYFWRHAKLHNGENPYVCKQCGKPLLLLIAFNDMEEFMQERSMWALWENLCLFHIPADTWRGTLCV
jgi:hypothetical protein